MSAITAALRAVHPPIAHAAGGRFTLTDGRTLMDLSAQTLNLPLGQSHPAVIAAVIEQAGAVQFASSRFGTTPFVQLSERLAALAPPGLDAVALKLANGSDAVETAIKIAVLHTRRRKIACLPGAWHGESFLTLGLASSHRGRLISPGSQVVTAAAPTIAALVHLVDSRRDLAAVIVDPALVSNGLPPADLGADLARLREACEQAGTLLIFDEIQTFGGWLGEDLFASEATGVHPDLICLGKALGAGYPLAAVLCRSDLSDLLQYNDAEFTYGGHPVSCAAALAGLDVLTGLRPGLGHRVAVFAGLLSAAFGPDLHEVRQVGLIATVTLTSTRLREVWARRVAAVCLQRGVFVRSTDQGSRLLLKPPLVLSLQDLEAAIGAAGQAGQEVRAGLARVRAAQAVHDPGTHLRGCVLRKPGRPNPQDGYVSALLDAFDEDLDVITRGPQAQEDLSRDLTSIGVPTAIMYAVPGQDAVDYDYIEGRSLQDILQDAGSSPALLNGLVMRHYELVVTAHDHGIVIGDRWPGNAMVTGPAALQLIDLELGYTGPAAQAALFEESFCVLQTLAAIPAHRRVRADLLIRLVHALICRHGPERAGEALERLAGFYRATSRPVHAGSAPAQIYSAILDRALTEVSALRAGVRPEAGTAADRLVEV